MRSTAAFVPVRGAMMMAPSLPLLLFLLLLPLLPFPSFSCGGTFCSSSQPVNQNAEQIIFSQDEENGLVTAVVRIMYEGPGEKFAWLLPVPGVPDVGLSSSNAFDSLRSRTDPVYTVRTEVQGECAMPKGMFDDGTMDLAGGAMPEMAMDEDAGAVTVEAFGSVGPYDYEVISVDDQKTDDPASAATEWLEDNGYDLMDIGPDVLRPYLEEGMNLLAFRLTKGTESGSIRPIVITYESENPMIPIRPTAVAAEEDMGILVWIVSSGRAVPSNYKHLILNEAMINWFNPSSNYDDVVSAAADEAGGRGFVTELAAPSAGYSEAIFSEFDRATWQREFAQRNFVSGIQALRKARDYYGSWDGFREAVVDAIGNGGGAIDVDDVISDPESYRGKLDIDAKAFVELVYQNVIKPVEDTQEILLSQPYLTRLYTTMSAEEMTSDPTFESTKGKPDVSNVHTATRIILCSPGVFRDDAPWRMEFEDGKTFSCEGCGLSWPFGPADMPAVGIIEELGAAIGGESGIVVADNSEEINHILGGGAKMVGSSNIGGGSTDVVPTKSTSSSFVSGLHLVKFMSVLMILCGGEFL